MSDQYPTVPHQPQEHDTRAYARQPHADYRTAPASMTPEAERTWGAVSHAGAVVAMICSVGLLGFVASIAVYVVHKDRGPFVRSHAANSLNLQISMFVWLVVAAIVYVVLGVVTLGIGFVAFLPIFAVPPVVAGVLHVIGAVKAYNGEWWTPPLTPQIVR